MIMKTDDYLTTETGSQDLQRIARGQDDVPFLPVKIDKPERNDLFWKNVKKAYSKYGRTQAFLAEIVKLEYQGLIANVDGSTWYVWNGLHNKHLTRS